MEHTKITFERESETEVNIMRDGKKIGLVWSEKEEGNLPYSTGNAVQLCGFDKHDGTWGCGIFSNKKDLIVSFDEKEGLKERVDKKYKYIKYVAAMVYSDKEDEIKGFKEYVNDSDSL